MSASVQASEHVRLLLERPTAPAADVRTQSRTEIRPADVAQDEPRADVQQQVSERYGVHRFYA